MSRHATQWTRVRARRYLRLSVTTTDAREQEVIRDLIVGILDLLPHTPIAKVGLNYEARFTLSSPTAWHAKGHELAPKEPWKDLMGKPGLINVTMRDNSRSDGHFDVSVGPAREPKNALAVTTNDHFDLATASATAAAEIITSRWEESLARSRKIAVALAVEQEG